MNEERKYTDGEGVPMTIEQMVKNEPEWVASRFRFMEDRAKELEDGIKKALHYMDDTSCMTSHRMLEALLPKEKP